MLQTVLRPVGIKGFVVLPKRWIVERTFGWLGRWCRHSKDYETTTASCEAMTLMRLSDSGRRISQASKSMRNAT